MKNVICIKTHVLTKQFENLYKQLSNEREHSFSSTDLKNRIKNNEEYRK